MLFRIWGALVLLAWAAVVPLRAADFPGRPVRIVVPSTPGGAIDVLARVLAPRLSEKWRQSVVVDNRSGGSGIVGAQTVARARPDGYTLIMTSANFTVNPFVHKQLPYKTTDFQPITQVGAAATVLVVHPSAKFRSLKDLIAFSKQNPASIDYASSGPGTTGHLAVALVERLAGIQLTHVPYKGAGDSTAALVRGEVAMSVTALAAARPFIQNGVVVPIGVTGAKRSSVLPDVPTFSEAGLPGYEVLVWYGIFTPAGTPKQIVETIYADIVEVMRSQDVTNRITSLGVDVGGMPPMEFARFIDKELKNWEPTVKAAGIYQSE